jgi:hypothetical protein
MTWNAVIACLLLRHDPAGGIGTSGDFYPRVRPQPVNFNLSNLVAFVALFFKLQKSGSRRRHFSRNIGFGGQNIAARHIRMIEMRA